MFCDICGVETPRNEVSAGWELPVVVDPGNGQPQNTAVLTVGVSMSMAPAEGVVCRSCFKKAGHGALVHLESLPE
jgi:hypothetical protein